MPFSGLVPGDIVEDHNVPAMFAGGVTTSVPGMPLPEEQAAKYIPHPPSKDNNQKEIDPTLYYFFLMDNFGINLSGDSYLALPFGLQWWPSSYFPFEDVILDRLASPHSMSGNQTFTGILLVPKNTKASTPKERTEAYQKIQIQVKRARTYLDISNSAKMRIVGDVELGSNQNGIYKSRVNVENPYPCRAWSDNYLLQKAYFPSASLVEAVEFCFGELKKKGLHKYIRRSIDSLDLARSLMSDSPLAHIIVWSAIEALLSPSDKAELISNISLSLIGLQPPTVDKMEFWDSAKKSYNIRSNIVHSFDIPEQKQLLESLSFAEEQCLNVLKFAISQPMKEGWGRDDLILFLKKKALI